MDYSSLIANDEKKPHIQEGPPIYIESLLSPKEFEEAKKLFPNTCHASRFRSPSEFKEGEYKWRYRMGESPTEEEIRTYNKALKDLLKQVKT